MASQFAMGSKSRESATRLEISSTAMRPECPTGESLTGFVIMSVTTKGRERSSSALETAQWHDLMSRFRIPGAEI